ncbi:hypothetical protein RHS01_05389 [Rhizoctonia solani]|uniref:Uncharacterized protein n=1 Tax=Rhizoctonia solani TaxID=456999 RepID=A0A8H7IC84_9AGAM|nr:hypothetical protein RHS01_05389 [Rhizoctonia solani]
MVQIPTRTRTRTLSFSVREACGRQRPMTEEPAMTYGRRKACPTPCAHSPTLDTACAQERELDSDSVPVPFPADEDDEWGTDKLPMASTSTHCRRHPLLLFLTQSPHPYGHTRREHASPLPLRPTGNPPPFDRDSSAKRPTGPRAIARKAIKAHFARTPHGAAVVKLGARRAIAQAECVAAVERVRKLSGEKEMRPTRLDVPRPMLLPPVLMDADLQFDETPTKRPSIVDRPRYPAYARHPTSRVSSFRRRGSGSGRQEEKGGKVKGEEEREAEAAQDDDN